MMFSSSGDPPDLAATIFRLRWLFLLAGLSVIGAFGFWLAYEAWGGPLVRSVYLRQTSIDWLNGLINRQDIHPLQYYYDKADRAARGAILVLLSAPLFLGSWSAAACRWPGSAWNNPLVGGGLTATGLWTVAYVLEVPVFQVLPHWFWALSPKQLSWWWLLPLLAAWSWFVLRTVLRNPRRTGINLLLLAVLSYCLQHGFALTEGRGLEAMRDCLLKTGHADFVHQALVIDDPLRLASHYGRFLEGGELPLFPHATKPPGALLFFWAFARSGQAFLGLATAEELATWAGLLFPVGACAAVVPLFFLCRMTMPLRQAWVVTSLFPLVPSTALILLHADQFLFPLLGLLFICCWTRALKLASCWWGLVAGIAFYVAIFASFALVALAPIIPVSGAAALLGLEDRRRWRRVGWATACTVIGFLGIYGVLYAGLGYSALDRFQHALAAHQGWKVESWSGGMRSYLALLNLIEFTLWCGIPLSLLAAADLWRGLRNWRVWDEGLGLSWSLLFILLVLGMVGKTAAESGRLWLFLVPLVLFSAARHFHRICGKKVEWATMVLALSQFVSIVVLKIRQDFLQ